VRSTFRPNRRVLRIENKGELSWLTHARTAAQKRTNPDISATLQVKESTANSVVKKMLQHPMSAKTSSLPSSIPANRADDWQWTQPTSANQQK
jgi:hypothetical protein